MARPSALTPEVVEEILKRFYDGAANHEAYEGLIGESTFYDYLKNNEEFREKVELAKEYTTEIARAVISRRIKKGDTDSAKWWLERKNKKQFSLRQELTGADGKDLPAPILGGISTKKEEK